MSAVASIVTPRKIILLSDGLAVDISDVDINDFTVTDDMIHSRSTKKILKVTDQLGLMWVGMRVDLLNHFSDIVTETTAEGIARQLSEFLALCTDSSLYSEPWYCINIHLIGYGEGTIQCYGVNSGEDTPLKPKKLYPNLGVQCLSVLKDDKQAQSELLNLFKSHRASKDLETAAIDAFTEFVDNDPYLGGDISCEVLQRATVRA